MRSRLRGRDLQPVAAGQSSVAPEGQPISDSRLTADRLLEIRTRLATGFYDRPSVHGAIAEEILRCGDVLPSPR